MAEPQEGEGGCCRCCVSFIFTSGLTALFLWLNLRVTSPTCSIENFYAFALNKSDISTRNNHTLSYDLKLKNRNKDKGVYYDTLNLTFYYTPNQSFPIGNNTFDRFYQGHQKSTHRYGSFEPRRVNWENASVVANNGTAVFTVELATAVRYKIVFWKTKRHRLVVKADLKVDGMGNLVKHKNKGIKLSSGPPKMRGSFGIFGTFLLGVFVFSLYW